MERESKKETSEENLASIWGLYFGTMVLALLLWEQKSKYGLLSNY